ncbi:hypothetical protein [Flavihumibacter petaseus]|nr:hypothetical protein [Flavihumibacter petaseus]
MRVSKHHYAIELALKGNKVYFLEPPDSKHAGISVKPASESEHLYIVRYKPLFRGKKYLPPFLYSLLISLQLKKLKDYLGVQPDVVWSFHPFLFENLKQFKAPLAIYFGADLFIENELPGEIRTADICFAVSPTILERIKEGNANVYFINHGLSAVFLNHAARRSEGLAANPTPAMRIGYAGNLLMEAPDHATMKKVIAAHPDKQFIFWGQYEKNGPFIGHDHPDVADFVDFLKRQANVILRGVVPTGQMAAEMQQIDMFWICWKTTASRMWDGSNSHKLLEYISTGRPVVAHHVAAYKGTTYLRMMPDSSNEQYPELFSETAKSIVSGRIKAVDENHVQFAAGNTYRHQLERIEALISAHVG